MIADLRSLYHVGLWDLALRELLPLVQMLHKNPQSWLFAEINDWDFPASRESLTLADTIDVLIQAHSKRGPRPKPYPRPFSADKRYGGRKKNYRRTPAELDALLASLPEEA